MGAAPATTEGDTGLGAHSRSSRSWSRHSHTLTPVRGGTPGPPGWQQRTPLPQGSRSPLSAPFPSPFSEPHPPNSNRSWPQQQRTVWLQIRLSLPPPRPCPPVPLMSSPRSPSLQGHSGAPQSPVMLGSPRDGEILPHVGIPPLLHPKHIVPQPPVARPTPPTSTKAFQTHPSVDPRILQKPSVGGRDGEVQSSCSPQR